MSRILAELSLQRSPPLPANWQASSERQIELLVEIRDLLIRDQRAPTTPEAPDAETLDPEVTRDPEAEAPEPQQRRWFNFWG